MDIEQVEAEILEKTEKLARYKAITAEVKRVSGVKVTGCNVELEAQNSVFLRDETLLTAAQKAVDAYVESLMLEAEKL